VKPGHWGCKVVFFKPLSKIIENPKTGKDEEKTFPLLRTYTIFNADQVEGEALEKFRVKEEAGRIQVWEDFEPAENLIHATGADVRFGGEKAFYFPSGDYIQVPLRAKFSTPVDYYETVLHELCHWTQPRRDFKGDYATGELVAEMGACFLAAELGVPNGECLDNHAAYLKSWLEAMKADSGFLFKAASEASKVCDFLQAFTQKSELAA